MDKNPFQLTKAVLAETKIIWLWPPVVVFMFFSTAVVLEQLLVGSGAQPAFGYQTF